MRRHTEDAPLGRGIYFARARDHCTHLRMIYGHGASLARRRVVKRATRFDRHSRSRAIKSRPERYGRSRNSSAIFGDRDTSACREQACTHHHYSRIRPGDTDRSNAARCWFHFRRRHIALKFPKDQQLPHRLEIDPEHSPISSSSDNIRSKIREFVRAVENARIKKKKKKKKEGASSIFFKERSQRSKDSSDIGSLH